MTCTRTLPSSRCSCHDCRKAIAEIMVEEVRKLVDVPVVVCLGADTHCVLSSSEPARETLVLLRSAVKGVEDHLSPTARLPRGIQRRRKRRVC